MANPVEISVSPDDHVGRVESQGDIALQDLKEAFEDYEIPVSLADIALKTGGQELKTAADREDFAIRILDAKRDLEDDPRVGGTSQDNWMAAIDKAAERQEKVVSGQDRNVSGVQAAVQTASAHWRKEAAEIQERYPGLNRRQVVSMTGAADRRAWLVFQIPHTIRERFGIKPEEIYSNHLDRVYQKIIDKKADSLLEQRAKALQSLRGVDINTPPHLLPSKQYRAAEILTRVDQQLRELRPLKGSDYGAAVASATGRPAQENSHSQEQEMAVPYNSLKPQVITEALAKVAEPTLSKHEIALQAIREMRAQTPVDGYRSRAAEAMYNRLVQQLEQRKETINLSARYQGRDQGQASTSHRNAIDANSDVIQAVREKGIPVDTGKASISFEKKAEVEFSQQVGQGQTA